MESLENHGESKRFLQAQILTVSEFDKWIVDFTPLDDRNSMVLLDFVAEPSIFLVNFRGEGT